MIQQQHETAAWCQSQDCKLCGAEQDGEALQALAQETDGELSHTQWSFLRRLPGQHKDANGFTTDTKTEVSQS